MAKLLNKGKIILKKEILIIRLLNLEFSVK